MSLRPGEALPVAFRSSGGGLQGCHQSHGQAVPIMGDMGQPSEGTGRRSSLVLLPGTSGCPSVGCACFGAEKPLWGLPFVVCYHGAPGLPHQ